MVGTVVEFSATGVAGDHAADGFDAVQAGQTIRANVGVVAFHPSAFEGQRVIRMLSGDAQFGASGLPFGAMGLGVSAPGPLIGDEVGEFVFEGSPQFFWRQGFEFGVELDGAVGPPRTTRCRLHPRIP